MPAIDDLIDLVISSQTTTAQTANFGKAAIVVTSAGAGFTDLSRTYQSAAAIDADSDFTSTSGKRIAKALFGPTINTGEILVINQAQATDDTDPVSALNDAVAAGADFYGFTVESTSDTDLQAVGAWALSNKRYYVFSKQVSAVSEISTSAGALRTATNTRAAGFLTKTQGDGDLAMALLGRCLAANAGAINWSHRTLEGIAADIWSDTERTAMEAEGINWYETVGGRAMTRGGNGTYEGVNSFGLVYPDITRGTDSLDADIKAAVVTALNNTDKIGFTATGASQLLAAVRPVLQDYERLARDGGKELLVPGTSDTLTITAAGDVTSTNKAQRRWVQMAFNGVYQGAVNKVQIRGVITA